MFKIGELARVAEVPVDTVRYYERVGLIPTPARNSAGYRLYSQGALARLLMVRRAKELGFSLSEIGELLDLYDHRHEACSHVQCRVIGKVRELDDRITELHRIKAELQMLARDCNPHTHGVHCPVLTAIQPPGVISSLLMTPDEDAGATS